MKKLFLIAILALIATFPVMRKGTDSGVMFTLTNVGTATLESVTVRVTGRSYGLGDLSPGSSKSIKVNPAGDSHIELAFSDFRRLRIDCYFGMGYRGRIAAAVTRENVVSVNDEVHLPTFY